MALKGLLGSMFPPKAEFSVDDIPDLTNRVVIVTGSNTGIGFETAKALLNHNAKVYVAVRNEAKGKEAIEKLRSETRKDTVAFLKLDLADLKSIKAAAQEFQARESELHILFNNGGVMHPPVEQTTADGYDQQFGTNVIGPFYFTKLLLPLLIAGSKSAPGIGGRVVNTSSSSSLLGKIDFDSMRDDAKRKKIGTIDLYSNSKYGDVVWSIELNRRFEKDGIVATAVDPGYIMSDLQRHMPRVAYYIMKATVLQPTPMGALTQLYAGTSPEAKDLGGKYFVPWARVGITPSGADNPELGRKLYDWMEEQVQHF